MTWTTMQPESGAKSAQDEEGGQLRHQAEPDPDYVRPHDPDPGHVRALKHYTAMRDELLGQK